LIVDSVGGWSILGNHRLADSLRDAARFVAAPFPITIATDPVDVPDDAFPIGPAVLFSNVERGVPYYCAFEAIEEITRTLAAGEAGQTYGCYTSFRISRGSTTDEVAYNCLLPALAVTLDLFASPAQRIHARRSSLLSTDDSWFVTIRLEDETILTIEALAVLDPAATLDRDLLVEVTASDRVLRAEPMRQAVVVEPVGGVSIAFPWWENLSERFLKLVAERAALQHPTAGSRLRNIWEAVQESAESGMPVTFPRT